MSLPNPPPVNPPAPYPRPPPADLVNPLHIGEQYRLPPPPALASALGSMFPGQSIPVSSLALPGPGMPASGKPESGKPEGAKSRLRPIQGSVKDGVTFGVITAFKMVRIMVLWIAFYFVDRAYQSYYMTRTMVEDKDPPSLLPLTAAALAIEAVFALVFIGFISLLSGRFKKDNNTFALDGPLISSLWATYIQSTVAILALGTLMGAVAQSKSNLRYGEDGMRGIRALCTAILLVAIVIIIIS